MQLKTSQLNIYTASQATGLHYTFLLAGVVSIQKKKLSDLSGLFNFENLDADYFQKSTPHTLTM